MAWWVYKCNSKNQPHQIAYGDWEDCFRSKAAKQWGSTSYSTRMETQLLKLAVGDMILAYQTDRNELVGVVKVAQLKQFPSCVKVFLKPIERIGVTIRPLKSDAKIAAIPAFKTRAIQTIYDISDKDANNLLKVARMAAE